MHRCLKVFLAGCTSAEPTSASFQQCKNSKLSISNIILKCSVDKYFKEKRSKKERNGMGYRPCSSYKVLGGICIIAYYSLFEKTTDPNFY
jgi:hypothetical protein